MKEITVTSSGSPLAKEELLGTIVYWAAKDVHLKRPLIKRKPDVISAHSLESRVEELRSAFSSQNKDSIVWALRGGYGMHELLPFLKKTDFKTKKIFMGFSDNTSLHYFLNTNLGKPSIHSPHPNALHKDQKNKNLFNKINRLLVNPNLYSPTFSGLKKINFSKLRRVEAKIIGGNLTTLVSVLGTKFDKGARGKILFLEELEEPAYKINRMLTHLDQAGFLTGVKAVVFGHMIHNKKSQELLIKKVLKRWAADKKFPVLSGMQAGHMHSKNYPFWLGKKSCILLDAKPRLLNNI